MEIVVALPDLQFLAQIDVIGIGQQLIKLLMVGQVRPLDLAVELWCSWLDVIVLYPQVHQVPMKAGLELTCSLFSGHGLSYDFRGPCGPQKQGGVFSLP